MYLCEERFLLNILFLIERNFNSILNVHDNKLFILDHFNNVVNIAVVE